MVSVPRKIVSVIDIAIASNAVTIKSGSRVLVKPTLRHGSVRDHRERLTTHPVLLRALVEVLQDYGLHVAIGDVCSNEDDQLVWLYELADRYGVDLVSFNKTGYRKLFSTGGSSTPYLVSNAVMDTDILINCANLQMHRRFRLAGGIKNIMNAVTHRQQVELFSKLPDCKRLSAAVVDIFSLVNPAITLLDLTSVRINNIDNKPLFVHPACLIASADPVAADAHACRVIGFDPRSHWTTKLAAHRGMGVIEDDRIDLRGDIHAASDIDVIDPPEAEDRKRSTVHEIVHSATSTLLPKKSILDRERCTRCGDCVPACPTEAVRLDAFAVPAIDRNECIGCGQCVDACAHGAFSLQRNFVGQTLKTLISPQKPGGARRRTNGSRIATRAVASRVWEHMKMGVSIGIGPVSLESRLSRRYCHKPHEVKFAMPCSKTKAKKEPMKDAERRRLALIVGPGPKLGRALANRLSKEEFNIALCARNIDKLEPIMNAVIEQGAPACAFKADATKSASVKRLFSKVCEQMGAPDLVIYNVQSYGPGTVTEISESAFRECWEGNCLGGFLVGKEAARRMISKGSGSIFFTGATGSTHGRPGYINLAVGKGGLRALAQCMAKELGPKGVHVAHVLLDGGMLALNPDAVAENYLHLYFLRLRMHTEVISID